MKYFNVFAWDNGYDYDKFYTEDGGQKFPSTIHRPKNTDNILVNEEYKFKKNKMIISYKGNTHFIGDYAIRQSGIGGHRNYEPDKYKDDSEIMKFIAGVNLLTQDQKVDIETLVVGLSLHTYHDYKEDMEDFLKDKTIKYYINGQKKSIQINNVLVVPQSVGCYYNEILNGNGRIKDHELLNKRYGIIDIGGNTVDAFIGTGIDPVPETQAGLESGLSDAFKSVSDTIPYNIIQSDYLKGKDSSLYRKSKIKDLQEACEVQFKLLAEDIYNDIIDVWNRQIGRVEEIYLTGGGALSVGQYLKKKFIEKSNKEVTIMGNPQMSNVTGYYKLGIYQSKEVVEDA